MRSGALGSVLGHSMLWSRNVFEAGLIVALLATGFLLYVERTRVRSPSLPAFHFAHDERAGTMFIQGTWTLEGIDRIAWPSQTTNISCERANKRCLEATAVVAGEDYPSLMPTVPSELEILRWDSDLIVARGQTALCVDTTVNVHLSTKAVTGLVSPREGCGGAFPVLPKRMRMIDGRKASLAAHGFAR